MPEVYVIGIDGVRPLGDLAIQGLRDSKDILFSQRLLELFSQYEISVELKERCKVMGVTETLQFVRDTKDVCTVIASGDPMFFGIGAKTAEAAGNRKVHVLPAISSLQLAFSRVGVSWQDAFLMSLHGSTVREWELDDLPLLAERHPKIALLTGGENNPARIAGKLPPEAEVHVLARLGYNDESHTHKSAIEISAMEFAEPNVMVALIPVCKATVTGLREDEFRHEKGLITKDEVRAVVLHALNLPVHGVMWDIGSGSGSVAIEAKRVSPQMQVHAIEKSSSRVEDIRANIVNLKAGAINVLKGEAPYALKELPTPDRVFIGGSGDALTDVIAHSLETMEQGGVVVVTAITLESLEEAKRAFNSGGIEPNISSLQISRSREVGGRHYMKAENQIFVIKGIIK
ncbi:precorrin-6y C5,15-methyltransferase (decarboxylating) subunit CbiE [Nitrospirota bacterium]